MALVMINKHIGVTETLNEAIILRDNKIIDLGKIKIDD